MLSRHSEMFRLLSLRQRLANSKLGYGSCELQLFELDLR
jgi:hypothetical protein